MQHGPATIDGSPERQSGHRLDHGSDIRLTLPASAENVVLVRHIVAALAEVLGLPRRLADDLKLAVTEACTNVVRHAYGDGDGDGTLEVDVRPAGDELTIVVTDHGSGLRPNPDGGGAGLGLGLIAALTDGLEIKQEPDNGSQVRMRFRRAG